jgi:UrcA family protein
MKPVIIAAVLVVGGIPAAIAQPVHAVDVYMGDLNLADPRDSEEAAWRFDQAAHVACRPFPDVRDFVDVNDWRDCRAQAYDEAMDELQGRTAHMHHRRGHVTTREYPPGSSPEPER